MTEDLGELKTRIVCLIADYRRENLGAYALLALKRISDQQMTYISFSEYSLIDEPVLKLYEIIVQELEEVIFNTHFGISSHEELKMIIEWVLENCFKVKRIC
ncbi:hypothetical protein JW823_02255 [bacterium]|nr:hypothetical protein [candidate division CSSED10-310 bacterium]